MATASPEKGQALQPSPSRRPEPTLSITLYREIASLAEAAELRTPGSLLRPSNESLGAAGALFPDRARPADGANPPAATNAAPLGVDTRARHAGRSSAS